jgi:hypothetical protein
LVRSLVIVFSLLRARVSPSALLSLAFPLKVDHGLITVYHSTCWLTTVHQFAVTDNNCSTAGAPFALANETNIPAPCPAADSPNGCRAGDMAGQFGNLTGTTVTANYYDPYISLDPTQPNYIGDLSFNVHWANFTVIACAKCHPYGRS